MVLKHKISADADYLPYLYYNQVLRKGSVGYKPDRFSLIYKPVFQ